MITKDLTRYTLAAALAAITACNTAERGADDDDPAVDAGPPETDACVGDSELCGAVCNNDGDCDTGETSGACPTECPDTNLWWARPCAGVGDCVEIDSAFNECAHQHTSTADTLHCMNLTPDERVTLRNAAPDLIDIAGGCGTNIVGWGAGGDYNPTTQWGSKRVRVGKVNGWYRLTRAQAGSTPGSPCNINPVWLRSGTPYADIDCDAAAGRTKCWSQGIPNSLIGVGTHLGGPFSHAITETVNGVQVHRGDIYFMWGAAGQPPVRVEGQPPNGP